MADHDDHSHHHHHLHRPHRLSVPPRTPNFSTSAITTTSRQYPLYPYTSSTPTPTPSKQRLSSFPSINNRSNNNTNSLSFLFLLLFSLRSLYSLLPFLRSSPSFSLFPFSFLVSLSSFLLTFSFSLFSSSSSKQQPIFSLTSISQSQHRLLFAKSVVLAVVFLLRFQALRYCGTAATILAEFSGNIAANFVFEGRNRNAGDRDRNYSSKVRGFLALFIGLFLLSISWDRIECFPLSTSNVGKGGFSLFTGENCFRVLPMLLPFLSGFLGSYERVSMNWGSIRQLGKKRVRLISLFFTTVVLFFPAVISFFMLNGESDGVSIGNLGWPLANTVVFGVLLSENYGDDSKLKSSKDFRRDFIVTFVCTLILELFYFPELSLWGLLLCGFLLWISVRELASSSKYLELGSDTSESISAMIMKPIRHILSERKSRKIALFLFINTLYMVVEFVAGFMSNSLGLISDASHMLFDCAALAIGLYASYISRLPANGQFNYGRGRFEVLSGYVNAVFLVLVGALIVLESFERILDPQEISTNSLLTVSIGGLVVNVVGLIFFHEEHHHAHGGGGCSHSHAHSDSHSHLHSHDHVVHDHGPHAHHGHNDHKHYEDDCRGNHKTGRTIGHHDHSHKHDHNDHIHKHDHNDHTHKHDHNDHTHKHDHHDHTDKHDHHDHIHKHDHHDHTHNHDHHDHTHKHDHHDDDHHHAAHHTHESPITSSSSLQKHSHEGCTHTESHTHKESCSHRHHQSSSDSHSHQVDFHSHSSFADSDSQLKEHLLERKPLKEPQKHHHHVDHNMEGIFLHVLADTMGSVGVVISTLLIKYKGWLAADPVCSIFISVLIISSVISLLRNSAEVLLQRVPRAHEQDLKVALDDVMRISGVHSVDNVHVWSFTNTEVIGTLSLHVSADTDKAATKSQVSHILRDAGIKDLTIQVEYVRDK
ncbi:Cation efflux protein [Macleaya cordata]|uniref:Cation efflux protein n=1 Tax=Macleaya cordata TaxID=56857 RepID=A0A200QV51_MACCD|nr:Cation efflux protein [Macleaya cordata]